MICVFSPAGSLTGGTYRTLRSILGFPRGEYKLLMPVDVKQGLLDTIAKNLGTQSPLFSLVASAEELKPLGVCKGDRHCFRRYGSYLANLLAGFRCNFLYIPHEHAYIPLGLSQVKWTMLLQVTPVVGSLSTESGHGFILFWRNMQANFKAGPLKILKSYARFRTYAKLIEGHRLLAVSRSIPYELEKLGVNPDNLIVLSPGVGVDPCPYRYERNRDIDLLFYARVLPEKGVYDFLGASKLVKKRVNRELTVAVAGLASQEEANRVVSYAKKLGIDVTFMFNLVREEALRVLSRAKLLVYPSKADAFPLVVLEALSCGTPVVAYGIPAVRFNFETEAVVKVPPGDLGRLVAEVLDALEHCDEKRNEAISYASQFSWERVSAVEWGVVSSLAI